MEYGSFDLKKVHILRVDPGEDILACVEKFLAAASIEQAVVLGGYGTMAAYHLHWVRDNKIPPFDIHGRGEGGIEILSMNGLVVAGEPHIHITLSTPDGAYGGHLEPECIAYVVCEIFFAEVSGNMMKRVETSVDVAGMGQGTVKRLFFKD